MFHFLKTFAFILTLSTPVLAQWGAVVAQPDTNRFINSTQTYGLVMPHQDIIIGKLDTTITSVGTGGGNGSKVIVGSLLNWDDNCVGGKIINGEWDCSGSYEYGREKEKSTDWYQAARGDTSKQFPTDFIITGSTAADSVAIWNRNTGELWMAFRVGTAGDFIYSGTVTGIDFKDFILYVTTASGGLFEIDFLASRVKNYNSAAMSTPPHGIQDRNKGGTGAFLSLDTGLAIASSTVNAVAVVRDPFGLTDVNGAPKHWWVAATSGLDGYYNPHKNAIYDAQSSLTIVDHVLSTRGQMWHVRDDASDDLISTIRGSSSGLGHSIFTMGADGATNTHNISNSNNDGGATKLAWTVDPAGSTRLAVMEYGSIAGGNYDAIIAGSTQGVYTLHGSPIDGNGFDANASAKQRFSSTVNAPVEFGDAAFTGAMESGLDSSPYANNLTVTGGSYVTAVFGNGYSSCVGCGMALTNQAEFIPAGSDFGVSLWFKSGSATPAAGVEYLFQVTDNADESPNLAIWFDAGDGTMSALVTGASSTDYSQPTVDLYDNQWHHAMMYEQDGALLFVVDGVEIGRDSSIGRGSLADMNDLYVGRRYNGTGDFNGTIDEVVYWVDGKVSLDIAAQIHAEGRKKLNMGTPVFANATDDALLSNAVIAVDALDNGIWAVAFSDQSIIQVFDGRIPIQQIAAPSGTVKDIALIQNAGSDSVGVAIVTTTNLKIVQPSVSLEKMALSQLYHNKPILITSPVVVDSAGVDGIFWTFDDAISAGANAGRVRVEGSKGSYGGFDLSNASDMVISGSRPSNYSPGPMYDYHNATRIGGTTYTGAPITNTSNAGRVTIQNFLIANARGGGASDNMCIHLGNGSQNIIRNNNIGGCDNVGIYFTGSWNTITNNQIAGCDGTAILQYTPTAQGNVISNNVINANGTYGIQIVGDDVIVNDNLMRNNASGDIRMETSSDGMIYDGNRFESISNAGASSLTAGHNNSAAW